MARTSLLLAAVSQVACVIIGLPPSVVGFSPMVAPQVSPAFIRGRFAEASSTIVCRPARQALVVGMARADFSPLSLREMHGRRMRSTPGLLMQAGSGRKAGPRGAITHAARVTVFGGGNFGLALAIVLANNRVPVTILVRWVLPFPWV